MRGGADREHPVSREQHLVAGWHDDIQGSSCDLYDVGSCPRPERNVLECLACVGRVRAECHRLRVHVVVGELLADGGRDRLAAAFVLLLLVVVREEAHLKGGVLVEGASGEEYEYDAGDEDGQHRPSGWHTGRDLLPPGAASSSCSGSHS